MSLIRKVLALTLIAVLDFVNPPRAQADGILTHEMIIDITWESSIVPVECPIFCAVG
jgi:hypothetical protein